MRKALRWIKGVLVAILGFIFYALYSPGNDLITTARRHITDLGGTPPQWLALQNEATIIKWLFAIIIFGAIILLILSWIEYVILGAVRWLRTITDSRKIVRCIPDRMIPKDGHWDKETVNRRLHRFVGRTAEFHVNIEKVESTPDDRYGMIPRVVVSGIGSTKDERTKLDVQLYAYFDGASADQIARIKDYEKNEQMTLRGTISRADIAHYDDGLWSLVIDLHNCSTL